MADKKILVENMVNATVTLKIDTLNFKRAFKGEGAKAYIPFETLYEGLSDNGVERLFTEGFLKVTNKQDRVDLGLEFEEEEAEAASTTMGSNEMIEIMKSNNPVDIKSTLEKLAPAQREKFAKIAIDNEIYSASLAKFIKDYTGMDLLQNIQSRKDALEDN